MERDDGKALADIAMLLAGVNPNDLDADGDVMAFIQHFTDASEEPVHEGPLGRVMLMAMMLSASNFTAERGMAARVAGANVQLCDDLHAALETWADQVIGEDRRGEWMPDEYRGKFYDETPFLFWPDGADQPHDEAEIKGRFPDDAVVH